MRKTHWSKNRIKLMASKADNFHIKQLIKVASNENES